MVVVVRMIVGLWRGESPVGCPGASSIGERVGAWVLEGWWDLWVRLIFEVRNVVGPVRAMRKPLSWRLGDGPYCPTR